MPWRSPLLCALLVPWLLDVLLALGAHRLARLMGPRSAVRLLPLAAVVSAGACGFSLSVVALLLLSHSAVVARFGGWSASALPGRGVSWAWGLPAAVAVVALLASGAGHLVRVGRQLLLAEVTCRSLAARESAAGAGGSAVLEGEQCTVVPADEPDAYSIPGLRGRIVVSSGMLAVLHGPQRAALLAHERSHLTHRHHLWIQAAEVSAAANPLLRRLPTQVRSATEQEADLDAVDVVGDRGVLMAAIASAALARRRHGAPVPVAPWPAATGADVVERVRLLREDVAPRRRTSAVAAAAVGVLIVAGVVSTLASASLTDAHYDRAELLARAVVSAPR